MIAEIGSVRREEHDDYVQAKADLELGLSGVRKALGLLRDYYGRAAAMLQQPAAPEHHEKAEGMGSSIVGTLEFAKATLQPTFKGGDRGIRCPVSLRQDDAGEQDHQDCLRSGSEVQTHEHKALTRQSLGSHPTATPPV